jgi:hypothetical protein
MTNIQIGNSILRSSNTGMIAEIDLHISALRTAGHEELSNSLSRVLDAIGNDEATPEAEKATFLKQLVAIMDSAMPSGGEPRRILLGAALAAVWPIPARLEPVWSETLRQIDFS